MPGKRVPVQATSGHPRCDRIFLDSRLYGNDDRSSLQENRSYEEIQKELLLLPTLTFFFFTFLFSLFIEGVQAPAQVIDLSLLLLKHLLHH